MEKLVIVGTGAAGLTAAIYAGRADLSPLVIEGLEPGGQLTTTTEVENFPGFPEGVMGPALMQHMRAQAERFGARLQLDRVASVDFSARPLRLSTDGGTDLEAESVILCTGASARYLGLESEQELVGYGVTSCATCDGAFFRDVPVAVVGGGDSAAEEATFLTRFASKVYLIHRRDELRASRIMADRVLAHEKVEMVWDTVVTEVLGVEDKAVKGLRLKNVKTDEESVLDVAAMFVAIGHQPNTAPFEGQVELDDNGYIVAQNTRTNVPGVFAAGDVQDAVYRQAITAAGSGCMAALEAERYLAQHEG
jgi:thioredoxin reductase (NADPH)